MNLKLTLAALLLAGSASARPYFRPLDLSHPQPVLGALVAPAALGDSEATSLLPVVTHSPADGCLLPAVVCEDWTPAALGASINAGKVTFVVAPLFNVLPWMLAASAAAMPPGWTDSLGWLKNDGQAITFSSGPAWEYKQVTNKGYFRVFTGLALHF